jgi:hypothetical protein
MKYTITEDRLVNFLNKFIEDTYGELYIVLTKDSNSREGDFSLDDSNGHTVFVYHDYSLMVNQGLFKTLRGLLNVSDPELEKIFKKWFEFTFPDVTILNAHASYYF